MNRKDSLEISCFFKLSDSSIYPLSTEIRTNHRRILDRFDFGQITSNQLLTAIQALDALIIIVSKKIRGHQKGHTCSKISLLSSTAFVFQASFRSTNSPSNKLYTSTCTFFALSFRRTSVGIRRGDKTYLSSISLIWCLYIARKTWKIPQDVNLFECSFHTLLELLDLIHGLEQLFRLYWNLLHQAHLNNIQITRQLCITAKRKKYLVLNHLGVLFWV